MEHEIEAGIISVFLGIRFLGPPEQYYIIPGSILTETTIFAVSYTFLVRYMSGTHAKSLKRETSAMAESFLPLTLNRTLRRSECQYMRRHQLES